MVAQEALVRRTLQNTVAGTAGGVAICLVGHPFDTLKVRLQTQSVLKPVYSGLKDCFLKTLEWEGVSGLYKGVGKYYLHSLYLRRHKHVDILLLAQRSQRRQTTLAVRHKLVQ